MSKKQPNDESGIKYTNLPLFPPNMTDRERMESLKELGRQHDTEFSDCFAELRRRMMLCDPVVLLSAFSFYGNRVPTEGADERVKWWLLQHDMEALQGLLLRHRLGEFERGHVLPPDFIIMRLLLQSATESFGFRRLAALDTSAAMEERQLTRLVETMRAHTEGIRNWGYPQQVFRITKGIFAKLEDDIEAEFGFRVAGLIDMFLNVVEMVEGRANAHIERLRPALRADTIDAALAEYYKAFPELDGTPEEIAETAAQQGASLARVKSMIVSHGDFELPSIYTLTVSDFAGAYPGSIEDEPLKAVLSAWSVSLGDLSGVDPEHLFLGNPIWTRPLTDLGEERYLWPIPGLFLSFCLEMIERLISRDQRMLERYYVQRSKYLEEETARLLATALPSAQVHRGSLWVDPTDGKEYENDVFIVLDSRCIVIEAKGGKVGDAARRGALSSLGDAVDELVAAPAEQAQRFAEFLSRNPGQHSFSTRRGEVNSIDTTGVRAYGRLSIVQELLPVLSARWSDLAEAGFVSPTSPPTPTMTLADLELVLEVLDDPASVIHYIQRRAELEEHAEICGDELDLLAFYMETGFNIGEAEFNGTPLFLYGLSPEFDAYFMGEWTGDTASKPERKLTPLWRDTLSQLRQNSPEGWLDVAYHLLCVAYEDQVEFEAELKKREEAVRTSSSDSDCRDMVNLCNGPPERRVAIVGLAYKGADRDARNERMGAAAAISMEEDAAEEAVVIGRALDITAYPYTAIGLFRAEDPKDVPR